MPPLDWIGRALRVFRETDGPEEACYRGKEAPGSRGCHEECTSVLLTELRPGARGTVTCLEDPWSGEARKLTAMGILPGAPVELLQTYPAHVFLVGQVEFAVDEELAGLIRVRTGGG